MLLYKLKTIQNRIFYNIKNDALGLERWLRGEKHLPFKPNNLSSILRTHIKSAMGNFYIPTVPTARWEVETE